MTPSAPATWPTLLGSRSAKERPNGHSPIARHALQTSMRLAEQWGVAESLEVQSLVLAAAGEDEKAAMLAGAADALRTTIKSQPYRFEVIFGERYLSTSRARLGPNHGSRAGWQGATSTSTNCCGRTRS